jgi:hypothetical protein
MKRTTQKTIIQDQLANYLQASLSEKTAIVSSICKVTGMHRKAVIRALGREQHYSGWKAPQRLSRSRYYSSEAEAALALSSGSNTTIQVQNVCIRR